MNALERLFLLEVGFHRRLRTQGFGDIVDCAGIHATYTMQCGYDGLIRAIGGTIFPRDLEKVRERLRLMCDARDLMAARDSVLKLSSAPPHLS